jgi:hypothetical protein
VIIRDFYNNVIIVQFNLFKCSVNVCIFFLMHFSQDRVCANA